LSGIAAGAALVVALTGCGRKGGLDEPPATTYVEPAVAATAVVQPAAVTAYDELREPPPLATGSVPEIGSDGRVLAPKQAPKQGPKQWTPIDWLID
jgi:predicted small lipoprotein YifL